jgi:hypothetical protein
MLVVFGVSGALILRNPERMRSYLSGRQGTQPAASSVEELFPILKPVHEESELEAFDRIERRLFSGELRVVAIGSAFPIPYDAEICPFSSFPQPAFNQLDRDGDGMTDEWENLYGLNRYDPSDAEEDSDKDGFTNIEEFNGHALPSDPASHPPYVMKLRFIEQKKIPFPLVFQGASILPDGSTVFQINTPADGRTHFVSLGEEVQEIILQRFVPGESSSLDRLVVRRKNNEIELTRGRTIDDPESRAELINILDHRRILVTMSALLYVHNDEYTVLSVDHDKAVVKRLKTGEVFDIVGLSEEGREPSLLESE